MKRSVSLRESIRRLLGRGPAWPPERDALFHRVAPFSMLGPERLNSLLELAGRVKDVPGDFVEIGTCRGGSAALLCGHVKETGWNRHLHLFDSFQGHPKTTKDPSAPDRILVEEWGGTMVASVDDVKKACRSLDAFDGGRVSIHPGWIEETLESAGIRQVALAHVDVDWYEPTLYSLKALLPKIPPGGFIQVDDYHYFEGCRKAVDEFVAGSGGRARIEGFVKVAAVISVR